MDLLLLLLSGISIALAVPLPTAAQLQWQHDEIGVIIHYNMATGKGQGCGIGTSNHPLAAQFQPSPTFDAVEWMESITALGAKYAVYVAKHECGFCTWPTKAKLPDGSIYPYAVGGPGATTTDIVGSFVKAAKTAGIKPAFYYSITENTFLNSLKLTPAQVVGVTMEHLAELWNPTLVGEISEVWFDGGFEGFAANISSLLATLQPNAVAFNGCAGTSLADCIGPKGGGNLRWVGTEAGRAPDPCWSTSYGSGAGDPNSTVWNPAESDTTLQNGDNWFWNSRVGLRSLSTLAGVYHATVGRNTNMLLDIAPMPNGSIPTDAKARYAEFGSWIRACYGKKAVATANMSVGSRTLTLTLPAAASTSTVDRVVLSEDLTKGELVRSFTLETLSGAGGWGVVLNKQSIGHKRIAVLPGSVGGPYTALRINVTSTLNGLPPALTLAAYSGEGCRTRPPCGPAVPGQPIVATTCTAPNTAESIDANQAWEVEVIGHNAGVGGNDLVRFKLLSSNTSSIPMCLAVSGPPGPGEYSNVPRGKWTARTWGVFQCNYSSSMQ
jgi:alpha-L-fucosidase